MIVDSSALVAVLLREPDYEVLLDALAGAFGRGDFIGVGTPTLAETGLVLTSRLGVLGRTLLARLVDEAGMTEVSFDAEHWKVAVEAFTRYGHRRHPAGLNFGDCLTYAIARVVDEPLLYIGDDFAKTDIRAVL
ncbi:type II toxin-antitoxin system VapC family toxin [Frankia sp. Cas3]|uniref:type II toxin-antitoxin system VapC family toxin n=1 Tax=Frankia sp. Cas3 TaxID=3073926 RepID=UPI002AD5AD57|nr:type II toxin-antitoxin system VapC family toxin [Frankia sp. Cas3]